MLSNDISKQDFDDWRNNAVTESFFQYLDDSAEFIKEQWEDGIFATDGGMADTAARANLQTLRQLRNLDWATIEDFYNVSKPEVENESA